MRLETERLILRDPLRSDVDAIADLIGNYNVAKTLSRVPHPYATSDAEWWLDRRDEAKGTGDLAFAIQLKGGPEHLIGVVGVHPERDKEKEDRPIAELGYWLGEPWWGQRIVSEAARAVVGHAFATQDLQELHAGYFTGNEASRRILEGLGFVDCGVEKRQAMAVGEDVDCRMLRIKRADWK